MFTIYDYLDYYKNCSFEEVGFNQRCDRAAGQSFDGLLQVLFGEAGLGGAFHDVG